MIETKINTERLTLSRDLEINKNARAKYLSDLNLHSRNLTKYYFIT